MNISNNFLRDIPAELAEICPQVQLLNLNSNPFAQDLFEQTVDRLAKFRNLKSLFLTLTEEE
jgi:hypothetical protein